MVSFNNESQETKSKIILFGPEFGGKTTNLQFVYNHIPQTNRPKITSSSIGSVNSHFIQFFPKDINIINDVSIKFELFIFQGQYTGKEFVKTILAGIDGLIFVVDSRKSQLDKSLKSFINLIENLKTCGIAIKDFPIIIQYNKRDLPDVLPIKNLNRQINKLQFPYFEAIATQGIGVLETLNAVIYKILYRFKTISDYPSRNNLQDKELNMSNISHSTAQDSQVDQEIQAYILEKKRRTIIAKLNEKSSSTFTKPCIESLQSKYATTNDGETSEFEYTPDMPGYLGVNEELEDDNSPYFNIESLSAIENNDMSEDISKSL